MIYNSNISPLKNFILFRSIKIPLFISFLLIAGSISGQLYHEGLLRNNDLTFKDIVEQTEVYYDNNSREKGNGYKQFQRWKYWAERNLDENGKVRDKVEALRQYNEFSLNHRSNQQSIIGTYEELGPKSAINTSTWSSGLGRISSIGLDRNNG